MGLSMARVIWLSRLSVFYLYPLFLYPLYSFLFFTLLLLFCIGVRWDLFRTFLSHRGFAVLLSFIVI